MKTTNIIIAIAFICTISSCYKERDSYCASCYGEINGVIQAHEQQCSNLLSTTEQYVEDFRINATLKGQSSSCSKYIVKDKY
jgi:hypothetical protein